MTEAPRAVGYIRVSTEEQVKHGWNLDADRERIQEIAGDKGYDLIEIYDDGGRQGDDPDRPGFNRMLDTLDQTDVIIMRSLDRLSRDTYLYALATRAIRLAGVKVESFNGPVDLESPEGELSSNVLAAIHRFEKRQIGVRVKQAMGARARAGHHHGRAPYGYDVHMQVIESQAAIVRRIFTEYAVDGISQREIVRRLNREGIDAQRGNWTQGAISKTLAIPAYVGKVRFNDEVYDGDHEPIVPLDLWQKAQQLRQANGSVQRGKNPIANHLLGGGMLRCGRCGGGMYAVTRVRPPRKTMEVYTCSTRQRRGLDACDQPTVKRVPIDEAIWRFVTETALDLEATKLAIIEQGGAKLAELDVLIEQAGRDSARGQDRLTRVRRDYQDGKLDPDDWREQRAELTSDAQAATAQLERLEAQRLDVRAAAEQFDVESAVLAELNAIKAAIIGEARDGSEAGVKAFRAALRRLFTGFELRPHGTFGVTSSGLGGVPWPQDSPPVIEGYTLAPRVRKEALNWNPKEPWTLIKTVLLGSASDSFTPPPASRPTNTPRPPSPPALTNG